MLLAGRISTVSKQFTVHVVAPIVIGGLIYLIWRSDSLLMFKWCDSCGIYAAITFLRHHANWIRPHLPNWFIYSLPDATWVYAATCSLRLIWRHTSCAESFLWCAVPGFFCVGGEIGQLIGFVPGTFCLCDLILCLSAIVAALLITRKWRLPSETELSQTYNISSRTGGICHSCSWKLR